MNMQFCATNALIKWLKTDLPRLPAAPGQQVGVNTVISDSEQMCWQLHIIENRYGSWHKTIIATEANSRFTLFLPVDLLMSIDELTQRLKMEWQWVLAETLRLSHILPRSDIALLLSELNDITFSPQWVKNTDRSVNGHVGDAGLWVTQTLADRHQDALSPELALELAVYLNIQPKRINKAKDKVIPALSLLSYCQHLIDAANNKPVTETEALPLDSGKVVYLKDFKKLH
jgi:hypothetical protein